MIGEEKQRERMEETCRTINYMESRGGTKQKVEEKRKREKQDTKK